MKRVEEIPAQKFEQEVKVTYSTAEVLQGLQSLRSKVFHDHPLSDTEIQDVRTALNSHSEFTEEAIDSVLKKLKLQQTKLRNSTLALDEKNAVDVALESLQAETRNQVATTLEG